ncbi:uncharacterized protein L199_004644 [Kwoniella botswanensis]|uniref:uncharacterized protein n=1 Tax=Kwoniella botswanensis TaxID=1268659 RepID=UPI00315DD3C6
MEPPPPYHAPGYLQSTKSSSRRVSTASSASVSSPRPRPRAGDFFGGVSQLSQQELDRDAINAGRSVRRRSPRTDLPPALGTTTRKRTPPTKAPTPPHHLPPEPVPCPLCPEFAGEDVFQHIRRNHRGYPFQQSDFPSNSVVVCKDCRAILKVGRTALTVHKKNCKGKEERSSRELARRQSGGIVQDSRRRSIGVNQQLSPPTPRPRPSPPPQPPQQQQQQQQQTPPRLAPPPSPALPALPAAAPLPQPEHLTRDISDLDWFRR